jgi:hypothetical protein
VSVVANVTVNVDARQATQNLQRLQQQSTNAANSITRTGKSAASATANIQRFGIAFRSVIGPLVAVTGAVNLLGGSLRVLGERQADAAALANGLKKLGGTTADLNRLQAIADRLGKQTLFNQEDFDRGFTLLTSFQSIGVASYERVAKAAADVAQVTRQDVNSSLLQLAKALQDPEKGLTALARSGTQFTESQKEQIKQLVQSGQQLKAQDFILKEIEKQYGDAAAAAGSAGYAGAVDSLQESFRDFQERLATGVEPAVGGTLKALSDLFDLISKIPKPVGQAALAIGGVTAAVVALRASIILLLPKLKALLLLIIANPWIALAAGITAATIALAGYRTETQRLSGAAESGDVESIKAARTRLTTVREEIAALKDRDKLSKGQSRTLQRLRGQEKLLVSGITTGTSTAIKTPAAGDVADVAVAVGTGKGATDKAARDAERAAEAAKQQLKAAEDINFALRNQLAITQEIDPVSKRMVEYDVTKNEIAKEANELRALAKSADELTLINNNEQLKQKIAQIEYEREINDLLAARAILVANLLKAASMPTVFNPLETQNEALQEILDKYPAIGAAADAAATLATSGMSEMIAGTKSAQEVFADFLNSIANALMQTAAKMIAQYIAIGIARIFAGFGTPSGFSPSGSLAAVGDINPDVSGFFSPNANGNAFGANGIIPFAKGGIVNSPTLFPFAKGTGLMGEAGPEAIMPLQRGANGKLGVLASGSGGDINVVVNVDASGSSVEGNEQEGQQLGRVIAAAMQAELIKQKRPGGLLA